MIVISSHSFSPEVFTIDLSAAESLTEAGNIYSLWVPA